MGHTAEASSGAGMLSAEGRLVRMWRPEFYRYDPILRGGNCQTGLGRGEIIPLMEERMGRMGGSGGRVACIWPRNLSVLESQALWQVREAVCFLLLECLQSFV